MTAFMEKVKNSISLTNMSVLNTLVNEVIKNLTTDIPATDFIYFGKNALSVDFANVRMLTVPGDYAGGSYVINRGATLQIINDCFNIYTEDITDSIFDKSRVFTNTESEAIHEAYMADKAAYLYEYTAEEIQDGSINIPTKPKKEPSKTETTDEE
jgi:anionic cell wall polymer biosynthesis LytR-Cps2A-Psr (LCP) family protein